MTETVELPKEAVEQVIDELEHGMQAGKRAHSHDDIRPSTMQMADYHKTAYQTLIDAHPEYELQEGDNAQDS